MSLKELELNCDQKLTTILLDITNSKILEQKSTQIISEKAKTARAIYGVKTKRLKEQVRRNLDRFLPDFMFELTPEEKGEVVANCDHLKRLKFSAYLPYAFTEHGALMLANVLNSSRAVQVSLQIVRTFVRLRQLLTTNADLARKLEALEKKYNQQFKVVFDAIRKLLQPVEEPKRQIGFRIEKAEVSHSTNKKKT